MAPAGKVSRIRVGWPKVICLKPLPSLGMPRIGGVLKLLRTLGPLRIVRTAMHRSSYSRYNRYALSWKMDLEALNRSQAVTSLEWVNWESTFGGASMRKTFFGLLMVAGLCAGTCQSVTAQDPFAFQFGYTLGYQNSFKYRVPAPPYFSVHPPVYYGKRYSRPYGESPFASWPLLQPNPGYMPMPTANHAATSVVNTHCVDLHCSTEQAADTSSVVNRQDAPSMSPSQIVEAIVIINPYALEQVAKVNNQ